MELWDDTERDHKRLRVKRFLVRRALDGCELVTYKELIKKLDLGYAPNDRHFHDDLDYVSAMEFIEGRPLITVLVVNQRTRIPGPGFFKTAEWCYEWTGRKLSSSKQMIFEEELGMLKDHWNRISKTRDTTHLESLTIDSDNKR